MACSFFINVMPGGYAGLDLDQHSSSSVEVVNPRKLT